MVLEVWKSRTPSKVRPWLTWFSSFILTNAYLLYKTSSTCILTRACLLQDEVEATDGCRPGAVSRGRQLRGLPEAVRRSTLLLALPGRRTLSRRPVLPPSCRGRRHCCHHSTEAACLPPVPGGGWTFTPAHRAAAVLPPPATALTLTLTPTSAWPPFSLASERRRRGRVSGVT